MVALYVYDHELARADRVTSKVALAEIRLAWWREVLDEIFDRRPVRGHPVAQALATAVQRRGHARQPLEAMIDGRNDALGATDLDVESALRWADAVEGSVTLLAARTLDPDVADAAPTLAGRTWGLELLRRQDLARGAAFERSIWESLHAASRAVRGLSVAAFPAVACATLVRGRRLGGGSESLATRLRLAAAVATGRL